MASGGHPAAAAVGGLLFAALLAAPAGAAVHALVVGINAYDGPPKLLGAVNDAHDVSAALKASGAGIVTTLLDGAATRERVFAEWQSLVANSAPGDLLVFHFAGHGIN
ncbi:MAG TPA: caspase family protein, partial [Propylenella sp.]